MKFNFGFKYEIIENTGLFTSYSIKGLWDLNVRSVPVKDLNHDFEMFWVTEFNYLPFLRNSLSSTKIGYEHISNGIDNYTIDYEGMGLRSRTINCINIQPSFCLGTKYVLIISPKFWWDKYNHDNPDIRDYYGNMDLYCSIKFPNNYMISSKNRISFITGKGRTETQLTIPISWPFRKLLNERNNLYWFFEYFDGYGETILTYFQYTRSFRIGLSISRE